MSALPPLPEGILAALDRPEAAHVRKELRAALRVADIILYRRAEDAMVGAAVSLLLEDRQTGGDIVLTWLDKHLAHLEPHDAAVIAQAASIVRERVEHVPGCVEFQEVDEAQEG